jgi:ribosome-binding factor A
VADQARARRLAVRIREIVANTLENQVKDPRLGMVTITDARLTPDLRDATLYYTVYGDDTVRAESAAALESARGVLRSQVGRQTGIKFTPTLAFIADVVPEQSKQIDELLAVAREADAGLAQVRQGATYAGDPDPYRHEQDDLDEAGTEDGTAASTAGGTEGGTADGVTEVDAGRRAGHPSDS